MGRKNDTGIPQISEKPLVEIFALNSEDLGKYFVKVEFKCKIGRASCRERV